MRTWSTFIIFVLTAMALPVLAQEQPAPATELRLDPLDRETPQGTMLGYQRAILDGDFERAARFLDLRNLKEPAASTDPQTLARQLKVILERALELDATALSSRQPGRLDDGLPEYRELLGEAQTARGPIFLYLHRVPDDRVPIWKVANRTVDEIPALHQEFAYTGLAAWLEKRLPPVSFLGAELFKFVTALIFAALAWLPLYLLGIGTARLLTAKNPKMYPAVRRFFSVPMTLLLVSLVVVLTITNLGLSSTALKIADAHTMPTIAAVWCLLAAITLVRDVYRERLEQREQIRSIPLIYPISTSIKVLLVVLATIMWLNNVGYEISTLLAGLGIGGVAVALVLQKPLEDVFGAITLYMQQPVKIGDFCQVGAITGTVQDISLRTTRIRTLEDTVVAVPNARMAAESINNLSVRTKILYSLTLTLSVDTTAAQLRMILDKIENLLKNHGNVITEGARVRFANFGTFGLEIKPFAYVDTTVFAEFLITAEQLNLSIMEIIEAAGARIVSPAYMQR
ncbi:MAG: mechanosensitive ion channel family protein [Proteobacteria bacterium]|nr:mechanosensitive ion channel family protein [Pseudomonadota bacterium]